MVTRHIGEYGYEELSYIGCGDGMQSRAVVAACPGRSTEMVVKTIQAECFGNTAENYRAEIAALSTRSCPNVVSPTRITTSSGTIAIEMPLLSGGALMPRILRNPLALAHVKAMGLGLLEAIAQLHELGLLHLDIHPGNVLFDSEGTVHLADACQARATANGWLQRYRCLAMDAPPECLRTGACSARADVYQAALVLYRAANGEGQLLTAVPNDEFRAARNVVAGLIPDRATYMPHVPERLRQAINEGLATDPTNRFSSVATFAATLRGISLARNWTVAIQDGEVLWKDVLSTGETQNIRLTQTGNKYSILAWIDSGLSATTLDEANTLGSNMTFRDADRQLRKLFEDLEQRVLIN